MSQGLENHETARISYVSLDWYQEPFTRNDYDGFDVLPSKPSNFEKMVQISRELSKGIPFLRVDLYNINKKIYFSELTFYPGAGFTPFLPDKWDEIIGNELRINSR